jgi:translation initiation factor 5A
VEEVQCPEVHFLFVSQFRRGKYLAINDHPCKILDFSFSKCACHIGGQVHVIGVDIFTGKRTDALVSHHLLISRLEVTWEPKQLLDISDDFFCSLIGDNHAAQGNVDVPNKVLGRAIRNFWAEGERNVMVMTARVIGINGVMSAWEMIEMKLLGVRGAGILVFKNLQTDATIDIPYPTRERSSEFAKPENSWKIP